MGIRYYYSYIAKKGTYDYADLRDHSALVMLPYNSMRYDIFMCPALLGHAHAVSTRVPRVCVHAPGLSGTCTRTSSSGQWHTPCAFPQTEGSTGGALIVH